jgi:hypothetical protein
MFFTEQHELVLRLNSNIAYANPWSAFSLAQVAKTEPREKGDGT